MRLTRLLGLVGLVFLSGCVSVGSEGMIMKSSADPVAFMRTPHEVKDLGFAQGRGCRYFVAAVVPFGNSDIQTAVDKALDPLDADALLNVTSATSLYGFIPVYNVFSFTCTTVKGRAVKFETPSVANTAAPAPTSAAPAAIPATPASPPPS